jgi:hypothetical protein
VERGRGEYEEGEWTVLGDVARRTGLFDAGVAVSLETSFRMYGDVERWYGYVVMGVAKDFTSMGWRTSYCTYSPMPSTFSWECFSFLYLARIYPVDIIALVV